MADGHCECCGWRIIPGYSYCKDCAGHFRREENTKLYRWNKVMAWYREEKKRGKRKDIRR